MAEWEDFISIVLPRDKVAEVKQLASQRNRKEETFGARTYDGVCESYEAHLMGAFGEMAAAIHFGVDVDRRIFDEHGDDGEDLLLPVYGVTQIKATSYHLYPWLRAEVCHDRPSIQTYMAAAVEKRYVHPEYEGDVEVKLIGWLPREKVITRRPEVIRGPLSYVWKDWELNPIERVA